MKQFFSILFVALLFCTATYADELPNNALRLTLRGADARDILFTQSPRMTYSEDCSQITVTIPGAEPETYQVSDIEKITFVRCNPEAIEQILLDPETLNGDSTIYTLDGRKVQNIKTRGTYIISGRKVVVK